MKQLHFLLGLSLLLFIFFSIDSQAQKTEKQESFLEGRTNFIIRKHWFRSQKYTDSLNSKEPLKVKEQTGFPLPPPIPKFEAFEVKTNTYFTIEPTFYQVYTTIDDFKKDTVLAKNGINNIVRIDRPELTRSTFDPYFWELREKEEAYPEQVLTNLETVEINKEITREIAGYQCYQVVLRYREVKTKFIELFVTDEINLNYNPIFNFAAELKKYYPLYVKVYFENEPNDNYEEYRFLKYHYPY